MKFVRIAICQCGKDEGEARDGGSLLPWVPFNFSISRRRLLYEQATQIPRLAPLAPFCRQIMAIKCQSCRIPGIFPVPYSVCRIQMLYCKFNNKYKSFPELTAKARPQHTHIHTLTQKPRQLWSSSSIFISVSVCHFSVFSPQVCGRGTLALCPPRRTH